MAHCPQGYATDRVIYRYNLQLTRFSKDVYCAEPRELRHNVLRPLTRRLIDFKFLLD